MKEWVDVTDAFSEGARHYKDLYMEINEVFDDVVEVSLFSCEEGPYEIYFSYDIFYGIIYVEAAKAYEKREEVKKELEKEYRKHKKATDIFINSFAKKHDVQMPIDIIFDFDIGRYCEKLDRLNDTLYF